MWSSLTSKQVAKNALRENAELEVKVKCINLNLFNLWRNGEEIWEARALTSSNLKEDLDAFEKEESNQLEQLVEKKKRGDQGGLLHNVNRVTLILRWIGSKLLKEYLSVRNSRRIRR